MTLIYKILKELNSKSFNYKGVRVNFFGIPKFKNYSKGSLRGTFSYIRKVGFIKNTNGKLQITCKGQKYIKRKQDSLKQFDNKFKKNTPRNLIVMFDIPEKKKAHREWLRWHLKKFNYLMIQKSVWVGPSPLPKEFLDYVGKIGIKDGFKTFKLARGYNFNKINKK